MEPSVNIAGVSAISQGYYWSKYTVRAVTVVMRPVSYENGRFWALVIQILHKLALSSQARRMISTLKDCLFDSFLNNIAIHNCRWPLGWQ